MNKKGFTVVELIAAFSLTMVISVFLFEILIEAKDIFIETALKTNIQEKTSIISKNIRTRVLSSTSTINCSGNACTAGGSNVITVNDYNVILGNQKIATPNDGDTNIKIENVNLSADATTLKVHFELKSQNLTKPYIYNVVFYYTV